MRDFAIPMWDNTQFGFHGIHETPRVRRLLRS
jgi:hypothetical protein